MTSNVKPMTLGDFMAQGYFIPWALLAHWIALHRAVVSLTDPRVILSVN